MIETTANKTANHFTLNPLLDIKAGLHLRTHFVNLNELK
jgi:hypothetical protein